MISGISKPTIVVLIAFWLWGLTACDGGPAPSPEGAAVAEPRADRPGDATPWPVHVELPAGLGTVDSGRVNIRGEALEVGCETCHESHQEEPFARRSDELKEWHLDLSFEHGDQPCFACHAPEDRTKLKLADGERLPFKDVQRLCAQCHGPQARDWRNGSHGGMRGYWDRTKGPRTRASCVSCHSPHAPAWPQVMPVFKPRDRFLGAGGH